MTKRTVIAKKRPKAIKQKSTQPLVPAVLKSLNVFAEYFPGNFYWKDKGSIAQKNLQEIISCVPGSIY